MLARIKDSLNFFSKLNFRKVFNYGMLLSSYQLSGLTKKLYYKGQPFSISIEPTTSCNLRCPECPSGLRSFTRPTGMLQEDLYRKVINELHPTLTYLILYFQGEPYLNPNFLNLVSYANTKKIYTCTSTNAHYLNDENARKTIESGLDRLIISIDGTSQDTYQSYRVGGTLDKVIEGAKNIVKWKKQLNSAKPYVIFQYLVVRPNEHQIEDVKRIAKEIGIDEVKFKTAQVYDYENGNPLIPTIDKYSRYKNLGNGKYALKNTFDNNCWKMWHSCVITWDGKIVPCCFDKDAHYVLGNLKEGDFDAAWKSDSYNTFRKSLLKSRKEIDICSNCSEGTKVWA